MTLSLVWSPEFETGIDIIDSQHRQLFDYLEQVEEAIQAEDASRVEEVARGLVHYAISHNTFEESLMAKAGYPMLEAHSQIHESFKERAHSYLKQIDDGADPMRVAREMRVYLGLWLINHIKREDRHYVPYVKKSLDRGFAARMISKLFG